MDASTAANASSIVDSRVELAGFERAALVVLAAAPEAINGTEWMQQLRVYGVRKPRSAPTGKVAKQSERASDALLALLAE
jgi:hypothetical protein